MKMKEFIEDYKTTTEGGFKILEITLKENPSISLKRVSKPGQRIYIKKEDLRTVKSGLGFQIISTSKGLMTNSQAKKQNLGGEIICEIC
jgi:small subunit ribosomal protein S8